MSADALSIVISWVIILALLYLSWNTQQMVNRLDDIANLLREKKRSDQPGP